MFIKQKQVERFNRKKESKQHAGHDRSIGRRLFVLVLVVILNIVLLGSFSWVSMNDLNKKANERMHTVQTYVNLEDNVKSIQITFKNQVQTWEELLLRGNSELSYNKYFDEFRSEGDSVQAQLNQLIEELKKLNMDLSLAETVVNSHKYLEERYLSAIAEYDISNPESYKVVDIAVRDVDKIPMENMDTLVSSIEDEAERVMDVLITEAHNEYRRTQIILSALMLGSIILTLFFTLLINSTYKSISKFIAQMKGLIAKAENGDLTASGEVYKNDELGQLTVSYNNLMNSLRMIITDMMKMGDAVAVSSGQITNAAGEVGKASESVAETIADIARGAGDQAKGAQDGSIAVIGVVESLTHVIDNITESEKLTINTMQITETGAKAVAYQEARIHEVKQSYEIINDTVANLAEKSRKVGQIIQVINEIAEQTNLLALNAAIEAARAGEYGKGFAVVADEVKKLADQSSQAAGEISFIIQGIQAGVEKSVTEMNTADSIVKSQEAAMTDTVKAFEKVKESVSIVNSKMKETVEVVMELKRDADSVTEAIGEIASIAQQNAASAEEVTSASEEQTASIQEIAAATENLVDLSSKLKQAIAAFKV